MKDFRKDIDALNEILSDYLFFSKMNLLQFNGLKTENYAHYFLDILARFRLNSESILVLLPPFSKDYRLKISINLILRSICSDILTALYLLTFYDKDDKDNNSLKNELDVMSTEYLRFARLTIEEDHELLKNLSLPSPISIEDKRLWVNSLAPSLLDPNGKIRNRDQIRSTSNPEIISGLKNTGTFMSEAEKYQRIKEKGFANYGFVFIAFKYYSQFQHFTVMSRKFIKLKPTFDTYYMALTIDYMLMTSDIILQIAKSPNTDFRTEIKKIRDKILMHFA